MERGAGQRRGRDYAAEELGERNTLILNVISLRKITETRRENDSRTVRSCFSSWRPIPKRASAAEYGYAGNRDWDG
jgi:hypothetical protein